MSTNQTVKTITIHEAIAKGYLHFAEEGDSEIYLLSDCIKDGKLYSEVNATSRRYFLLEKEASYFELSDTDIAEAICDLVDNQESFQDEDMGLVGYVADLQKEQPELFSRLKDALNEKFKNITFHPATDIELMFPK